MARDQTKIEQIESILHHAFGGGGIITGGIATQIYEDYIKPLEEESESKEIEIIDLLMQISDYT